MTRSSHRRTSPIRRVEVPEGVRDPRGPTVSPRTTKTSLFPEDTKGTEITTYTDFRRCRHKEDTLRLIYLYNYFGPNLSPVSPTPSQFFPPVKTPTRSKDTSLIISPSFKPCSHTHFTHTPPDSVHSVSWNFYPTTHPPLVHIVMVFTDSEGSSTLFIHKGPLSTPWDCVDRSLNTKRI